jgi:serine/threonine protein kinase
MAPQVLSRQPYTTKCDVWSLGVIYYEMLFNAMPWMGRHENELLNNIKNHKLQIKQCSPFSEEFLRLSLAHNEADRSSWERVFELFDAQEKLLSNSINRLRK